MDKPAIKTATAVPAMPARSGWRDSEFARLSAVHLYRPRRFRDVAPDGCPGLIAHTLQVARYRVAA
jgi:hypothetical protein